MTLSHVGYTVNLLFTFICYNIYMGIHRGGYEVEYKVDFN